MCTNTPLTHRYVNTTGVLMHRYVAAVCCWLQARTGLVAMPGGKVSKVEQAARHVAQASAVLEAARYCTLLALLVQKVHALMQKAPLAAWPRVARRREEMRAPLWTHRYANTSIY
jgi:hypothetical protein